MMHARTLTGGTEAKALPGKKKKKKKKGLRSHISVLLRVNHGQ